MAEQINPLKVIKVYAQKQVEPIGPGLADELMTRYPKEKFIEYCKGLNNAPSYFELGRLYMFTYAFYILGYCDVKWSKLYQLSKIELLKQFKEADALLKKRFPGFWNELNEQWKYGPKGKRNLEL